MNGTVLGRGARRASLAAVAVGILALAAGLVFGDRQSTLGALAASWLFFSGLAAGGVALAATIRLSRGRWAGAASRAAEAGSGFFPVALVLLAALVLAARGWIPGAEEQPWGDWILRAARDLGAGVVLFVVGTVFVRRSRATSATPSMGLAVVYLLLYVATLSLWAVDLVMDLEDWSPSTVVPPFVFVGALLAAIASTALVTTLTRESDSGTRHDLGKLLFAFVILWGYLLWAAYLPVWYGNIPDETAQLLERWEHGWWIVTLAVIAAVLVFPFFFLLPERVKRGRVTLGIAAASILCGLVGERFLLVLPALPGVARSGAAVTVLLSVCIAVGVLGAFVLTAARRLQPSAST